MFYVLTPDAASIAEPLAVEPVEKAEPTGASATPDLLPGVDLVTEEIEPGVYQVVSDGAVGPVVRLAAAGTE